MKRLINALKFGYYAFKNPLTLHAGNFKMLADLHALIMKVAVEDKHLMTHIAYIHPTEGEQQIVSPIAILFKTSAFRPIAVKTIFSFFLLIVFSMKKLSKFHLPRSFSPYFI